MKNELPVNERMRNCLIEILGNEVNQWIYVSGNSIAKSLKSFKLTHNFQPIIVDALVSEGCIAAKGERRAFQFKILRSCMKSVSHLATQIIDEYNKLKKENKDKPKVERPIKPKMSKNDAGKEFHGKPIVTTKRNPNLDDIRYVLIDGVIIECQIDGIFRRADNSIGLSLIYKVVDEFDNTCTIPINAIGLLQTFETPEALVNNLLKNIVKMKK